MSDESRSLEPVPPFVEERALARKFGLRELVYPDSEQIRALVAFLGDVKETGRCGAIPKTAVVLTLEFLQSTLNRQSITKGPHMSQEEFDALQAPYYLAARIVTKIQRSHGESTRGAVYQKTWCSLGRFASVLRNLLDPSTPWLRTRVVPEEERESMLALREFLLQYPEQRRKGRAL